MDFLLPYDQDPERIEAHILDTLEDILQREGALPLRTLFSKACRTIDDAKLITKRGQHRSVVSFLKSQGGGGANEFILSHPGTFSAPHDFATNNKSCVALRDDGGGKSNASANLPAPPPPPVKTHTREAKDLGCWVGHELRGRCVFWNKAKGWGKVEIIGFENSDTGEIEPGLGDTQKPIAFMHSKVLKGSSHLLCNSSHLQKGQIVAFEAGNCKLGKGLEVFRVIKLVAVPAPSTNGDVGMVSLSEEELSSGLKNISFGRRPQNFIPRQFVDKPKAPEVASLSLPL